MNKNTNKMTTIKMKVFRYKFTPTLSEFMYDFSKLHRYDDRKVFKEAWNQWIEEEDIKPLINEEIKELHNQGYEGDILDKMFKSARYYYRKKPLNPNTEPVSRKEYVGFSQTILDVIDKHIYIQIQEHTKIDYNNEIICKISPANAYKNFCDTQKLEIEDEIKNLAKKTEEPLDPKETSNKFKKTYKNRYYIITNK